MWFENDLLNILLVLAPLMFLMWLEKPKEYTNEDYDRAIKHFEKLEKEENSDPRTHDTFYLSDRHHKLKEEIVSNIKDDETKIVFVPKWNKSKNKK